MSESRTPIPVPRPTRRSALLLWVISAAGLFAATLVLAILLLIFGDMDVQIQMLINSFVYYLPFLALPVYLVVRREPEMWRNLRPYPISIVSVLVIVVLALASVILMTNIIALWTIVLEAVGLGGSGASLNVPASTPGLLLCIFHTAVMPAIFEEFLFRGVVLPAFERNGTRHAVAVSAVLFALLHGSLTGLPAHLLLGLIMGTLVVCCNSIYAGLIFHTAYNAATIILVAIARRGADAAEAESARMLDVIGGLSGVIPLVIETLMLGAIMLFGLRLFRLRARLRGVAFVPRSREPLSKGERRLLIAGLVIVLLLFIVNILI